MSATSASTDGLGELYQRLGRRLRSEWSQQLTEFDVSPHQTRAMRVIAELGEPRLREVADRLRIAPRSVTDVVDALEEKGLVERFGDPADRRAVCVRLSEGGHQLSARLRRSRHLALDASFEVLDADERAELRRLLEKLVGDHRE